MPHRFDEDRRKQIRPVGPGLAGPRRTRGAPPDRHLRRPGRTAPQPPHRSAPTSTPSTATATSTGSRPWPWSASTGRPGEPSRGNVGVFRLDKNRERVFNHDWFALVPPTPDEIREAHLAQNPRPSTSAKAREAGTTS